MCYEAPWRKAPDDQPRFVCLLSPEAEFCTFELTGCVEELRKSVLCDGLVTPVVYAKSLRIFTA